ncbi:MAG: lipa: lipoyl synthase, partial [Deltaproteobacteria bacterium]|nr:lipa: lipoyl synthase [Deltaproteobacteria bacterium]
EEILSVMDDLRTVGCDVITIGQYLRPSRQNLPVVEYVEEMVFAEYGEIARKKGFRHVASAPLVRSSFNAEEFKKISGRWAVASGQQDR